MFRTFRMGIHDVGGCCLLVCWQLLGLNLSAETLLVSRPMFRDTRRRPSLHEIRTDYMRRTDLVGRGVATGTPPCTIRCTLLRRRVSHREVCVGGCVCLSWANVTYRNAGAGRGWAEGEFVVGVGG